MFELSQSSDVVFFIDLSWLIIKRWALWGYSFSRDRCTNNIEGAVVDSVVFRSHRTFHCCRHTKMATMLAVPLKNSAELDLVRPLKNFIKNTFGDEGSDDYSSQLDELHRLRNNAVCRKLDKHNTSLETLARCVAQNPDNNLIRKTTFLSFARTFIYNICWALLKATCC